MDLLSQRGIGARHVPLLQLRPTHAASPQGPWHWVLITSANTVRWAPKLKETVAQAHVVAVGQRTADALSAVGVASVWVGRSGGGAAVQWLSSTAKPSDRVLYIGTAQPAKPLCDALNHWGHPVVRWAVYDNVLPENAGEVADADVALVTLTSPSAARRYACLSDGASRPVVTIGSSTGRAARAAGLEVLAQARHPSMTALADAVAAGLAQLPCR